MKVPPNTAARPKSSGLWSGTSIPVTAVSPAPVPTGDACSTTDLYPLIASADALVMATPIYYFNMSGQLKTFIDRCIAVDVGGGKRGLRGKKLAVTMAYEGDDPFDSGCINAIRCFQDICRYTGMELKGQAYGTALEPGAILANKKLLDEARELGRILLS